MISSLHGSLIELNPPLITLEVNGVGYELELPISHLTELTAGGQAKLYTHLVIREDAHLLYGFNAKSERDCFRQLIKISGIGPKIALALLSTLTSQQLAHAIDGGDSTSLCLTPGIGKRMAERMLLELKGKLVLASGFMPTSGLFTAAPSAPKFRHDLSAALESLGYSNKEISQVLNQLLETEDLSLAIKQALKLLSKS